MKRILEAWIMGVLTGAVIGATITAWIILL